MSPTASCVWYLSTILISWWFPHAAIAILNGCYWDRWPKSLFGRHFVLFLSFHCRPGCLRTRRSAYVALCVPRISLPHHLQLWHLPFAWPEIMKRS